MRSSLSLLVLWVGVAACAPSSRAVAPQPSCSPSSSAALAQDRKPNEAPVVGVGAQYDTTHVYVPALEVDHFAESFIATFGGQSTKQAVATVTPTPSTTTTQLLQTPVGSVSLFGFKTPIPYPFGAERTGYLVSDMDSAIASARALGADVIVSPFPDPIGRDAIIQWPGGVNMQLYIHFKVPSYGALKTIPENRVYVSIDRADAFVQAFVSFSHGSVSSDTIRAPGIEIGRPSDTYRRIRIESAFGKMVVLVSDGHLPYPYGREITGYEVDNLDATLDKARAAGVTVLGDAYSGDDRRIAMLRFPGDYVAEVHSGAGPLRGSSAPTLHH